MPEANPALEATNGVHEAGHVGVYVWVVIGYRGNSSVVREHNDDREAQWPDGFAKLCRGRRLYHYSSARRLNADVCMLTNIWIV